MFSECPVSLALCSLSPSRHAFSMPCFSCLYAGAAPLLCAGITVYSPFIHYGVRSHHSVGVVGLGGLGHMAVKILAAMGCDVRLRVFNLHHWLVA